jgi:hypothetical protein
MIQISLSVATSAIKGSDRASESVPFQGRVISQATLFPNEGLPFFIHLPGM